MRWRTLAPRTSDAKSAIRRRWQRHHRLSAHMTVVGRLAASSRTSSRASAIEVEPRRTAVQRTLRVLLVVLAVLLLVLLATGLWIAFRYQPSGSFQGARPQSLVRQTHRTASTLFVFTALATFGMSIAVS